MNSASKFWDLVQTEIDAQRDPLEHLEVLAWLKNHPADLDAFASLRAVGLRLNQDLTPAAPASSASPGPAALPPVPPPAFRSQKLNSWRLLRPLVLTAAALAVYLMLPENTVEPEPASPPLAAFAPSTGNPKPIAHSKPTASLISIEHHRVENFAQTNFAPADPQSGAIILSMSTSTLQTTL
jgi:hypothetical protein